MFDLHSVSFMLEEYPLQGSQQFPNAKKQWVWISSNDL